MKKILLSSVAVAAFILFWVSPKSPEAPAEKFKSAPGYFTYYKEIKGEMPENILNEWAKADRLLKKGNSVLDSLEEIGPYNIGGRTRAILVDHSDPNRIFVGAISGGLWISETKGRGWRKVNDHEISLNITHITQSPFNPDILYYCTGEGAGNSSAAPGAGIFKSTDHGETFTQLPASAQGDFNYTWRIVHSLTDSNTIYIGTQNRGMFRSVDAGASFEKILVTTAEVHDIEVFTDGSVMATVRGNGVFYSPDGTPGSFVSRSTGIPAPGQHGRIEIAYCATEPTVMYAAVSGNTNTTLQGFYKSINGGLTWVSKTNPTSAGGQFPFTWYCLALHVKRDDPNTVFIGSVRAHYTVDGGNFWNSAKNTHADYHVVADHPSMPDSIYVGNDGGIYVYDWSSMSQAEDLNWGLNITQYYTGAFAPSGTTLMGGTQDNGTSFTIDGKDTFGKAFGADGSYTQISQQDPSLAYLSSQNGQIRRVDNFGSSGQYTTKIINDMDENGDDVIDDGAWFIHPFDINPQDGEMVFYPTKKRLYRSTNGGIIFEKITNEINVGTGIQPFCVGISNQKNPTVYIGGSNSLLYRVRNAATATPGDEENLRNDFVPLALRTSFIGCLRVSPVDPSTVYVGYTNYSSTSRIWKMIHADTDTPLFVDISGNLPTSLAVNWIEVDPASPDTVLFAATDFGLYFTTDGGTTWEKEEGIPNVVVDMIRLRMSDRKLFIFTHGRGVYTAKVTPYDKPIPPHDIVGVTNYYEADFRVYPNPAQHSVRIAWPAQAGDLPVKLHIYDQRGILVKQASIRRDEEISLQGLLGGVYFLRLEGLGTSKVLLNP